MTEAEEKEILKIADKHWEWIEGLWESMPDDICFGVSATEYLYKTAFLHGWKHAKTEEKTAEIENPPDINANYTICNCNQHRRGESTGGWFCPAHGQQL